MNLTQFSKLSSLILLNYYFITYTLYSASNAHIDYNYFSLLSSKQNQTIEQTQELSCLSLFGSFTGVVFPTIVIKMFYIACCVIAKNGMEKNGPAPSL